MQQRVALARALICSPAILLMDEPFASIDELLRDQLDLELRELSQKLHQTVIFVTHSIPEAAVLSDRVIVLSKRPARIRTITTVSADVPRQDFRRSPEHSEYVTEIRASLEQA
jgi:NitT/TauT family transport system ATP-binding protein